MINIAGYIVQLLHKHDCVIVPEFGGFIANYKQASIDHVQGYVHPPSQEITFNQNLTSNDGLLVNYIVQQEQIPYEEALTTVAQFAESCRSTLASKEILTLPQVGKFYYDIEDRLQFIPDEGTNFLLASFGLPRIQAYPILRATTKEEKTAMLSTVQSRQLSRNTFVARRRVVPLAAAIILLFVFGTVLYNNSEMGDDRRFAKAIAMIGYSVEQETPSEGVTTDATALDSSTIKDLPSWAVEDPLEVSTRISDPIKTIQDDPLEHSSTSPSPPEPPTNTEDVEEASREEALMSTNLQTYIIVVGCFSDSSNADRLIERIVEEEYVADVRMRGQLYQVGIEIYCPPETIMAHLAKIRQNYSEGAWILQ